MMVVALTAVTITFLLLPAGMADGPAASEPSVHTPVIFGLEPAHAQSDAPFKTTWETTSVGQTITIPLEGSGITIDWGDGQTSTDSSGLHPREYAASGEYRAEHYRARSDQVRLYTHEYASVGEYAVSISGGLTAIVLKDMPAALNTLKSIDQWGDISWTSMRDAFHGAGYMVNLAADTPDLSRVTDMTSMFESTDVNQPLDSWDVSSVTNMNRMFSHAFYFNQPLDSWDVSSVTNMNRMFSYAFYFNQPLDSWDVSSVTDMNEMFRKAKAFNQPLDSWDVSSVTNMENMVL